MSDQSVPGEALTDATVNVPERDRGPHVDRPELAVEAADDQVTFSDEPCEDRWLIADEELVVTGEAMQ